MNIKQKIAMIILPNLKMAFDMLFIKLLRIFELEDQPTIFDDIIPKYLQMQNARSCKSSLTIVPSPRARTLPLNLSLVSFYW